VENIHGQAE